MAYQSFHSVSQLNSFLVENKHVKVKQSPVTTENDIVIYNHLQINTVDLSHSNTVKLIDLCLLMEQVKHFIPKVV